jgi:hypothetical protein
MAIAPKYMSDAATLGLDYYRAGKGGAGLTDQTLADARLMAKGTVTDDKILRANAWQLRHASDLNAPQNHNANDPDYPGAGAVAHLLWGINPLDPQPARDWFLKETIRINKTKNMSAKTYKLSTIQLGKIFADQGMIMGVSVITEGDALGHGVMIDAISIVTIRDCALIHPSGLKVMINHEDGIENTVGVLRNFVIDGIQLRADLQMLLSSDYTAQVLEMAQVMPESFGMSISFSGDLEEIGGLYYVRCMEIYSCDIVDMPAANPSGLFSAKVDSTQKAMDLQAITIELSAEKELRAAAADQAKKNYSDFQNQITISTQLSADVQTITAQLSALSETNAKLTTELAAAQANIAEKINAEAVRVLASRGHAPIALGAAPVVAATMSRAEFSAMPAHRRSDFVKSGGKLND